MPCFIYVYAFVLRDMGFNSVPLLKPALQRMRGKHTASCYGTEQLELFPAMDDGMKHWHQRIP